MEIQFYKAECGDAAKIRFLGNDQKFHNIFIDSGHQRTFRPILLEEILNLKEMGEYIDLWILSHIHDDHIGGVLKYLDLIKSGELEDIVTQWYYNVPRFITVNAHKPNNKISNASSINQADIIYEYLKTNKKLPEKDITADLQTRNLFGLILTLLTPSSTKLNKLRNKYPIDSSNELERHELDSVSDAKAIKDNDYLIRLLEFEIEDFVEDKSVENGSSISLITEFKNRKILWLADSHPNDVIKSLEKLGYSKENQFECDWVKVSHHGSSGNNSSELYSFIKCTNYLFSVNGENKYNLPEKKCLARILRNKNRSKGSVYNFYFTYDNELLRSIFKVDGTEIYNELKFNVHYLKNSKYLKIDISK